MNEKKITVETKFKVEFYDVDAMRIVWHGNYIQFMEKSRCALLDAIGYNYNEMINDGFMFPMVAVKIKYRHSFAYGDTVRAKATLVEWENRLKIAYEFYNEKTGKLCTKAESTQMAVSIATGETSFVCPPKLLNAVNAFQ